MARAILSKAADGIGWQTILAGVTLKNPVCELKQTGPVASNPQGARGID
jgi:hypothetical protein